MIFNPISSTIIIYVTILLAMAFFTLLERKALGYFHIRKGPNKVGLMGLPQPLSDAAKLFLKELSSPAKANFTPFLLAPTFGLILALSSWMLYPFIFNSAFFQFGILMFLAISSLNVYSSLIAGWTSNSKYALLGALRGMAQSISYEVSMALILMSPLFIMKTFNLMKFSNNIIPCMLLLPMIMFLWMATALAETNRTPFDLAEGESELVSGFNTEYSSGSFAMIFMAEYTNILFMGMLTLNIFFLVFLSPWLSIMYNTFFTLLISFLFIWVRASYPRMRYDQLMNLTWKSFLPLALSFLLIVISMMNFF